MTDSSTLPAHVDVLVIGAGLSGVGAGCHLRMKTPSTSFVVLEARDAIGGTWDLFRYPGIRSDSDMYTLGYDFRPWQGEKSIADGASIRDYIQDTADEYGVTPHIRFGWRVTALAWDSDTARWTATAEHTRTGETRTLTADFVHCCTGYYRYDEGYLPEFPGYDDFTGTLIHPQHWPEDLDVEGKRIVVIGSGATAMTLVPSLARVGARVTMLQRSPTYVISLPGNDPIALWLHDKLPARTAHRIIKWKNVLASTFFFRLSKRRPDVVRGLLRKQLEANLPADFDIDTHFTPRYDPWDQRLCLVPDGDLFAALRSGNADIVTDHIDTFTETGIRLRSGEHLDADIIVTATGLNMLMVGGIDLTVDDEPVEVGETIAYKAMMLSGVPNFAFTVGYTNASWTLKADMVSDYVTRLVRHMDEHGYDTVVPQRPPAHEPIEPINTLSSGYIARALHLLPKAGSRHPWRLDENYLKDRKLFRGADLEDEGVRFERRRRTRAASVDERSAERVA